MGAFFTIDGPIAVDKAMGCGQLSMGQLWSAGHRRSGAIGQSLSPWQDMWTVLLDHRVIRSIV